MSFQDNILFILKKSNKKSLIKIQFLMIVCAFLEMSTLLSILPLINILIESSLIYENDYLFRIYTYFNFQNENQFIIFITSSIVFLFVSSTILILYTRYSVVKFSQNLLAYLGSIFFKKYLNMKFSFFTEESSSDIIRNLHDDLNRAVHGVIQPLMFSIARINLVIFLIVSLFIYNFKITFFLILILTFCYLIIFKFVKKTVSIYGELLSQYSSKKIKLINETFSSIKDILIIGRRSFFLNAYEKIVQETAKIFTYVNLVSISPRYLIDLLGFTFILFLIIFYKVNFGYDLESILPTITFLLFASYKLIPSFQEIYSSFIKIKNNKVVLRNIKKMFDENPTYSKSVKKIPIDIKKSIEFKNLSFNYKNRSKFKVLNRVSFQILVNKTNAFVGGTGSGKSTLMEIILGFHDFEDGQVLIDGKIFDKNNLNNLWKKISYVPQNSFLLDDTIISNICFGEDKKQIKKNLLKLSLKIAQLEEFINSLPNKIETLVGEKGVQISGGQKQRICIARAIYQNRKIIFLDEAMSALDENTENKILKSLQQLKGKTILLITHRLKSISNFDNVFILKDKKLTRKNKI